VNVIKDKWRIWRSRLGIEESATKNVGANKQLSTKGMLVPVKKKCKMEVAFPGCKTLSSRPEEYLKKKPGQEGGG